MGIVRIRQRKGQQRDRFALALQERYGPDISVHEEGRDLVVTGSKVDQRKAATIRKILAETIVEVAQARAAIDKLRPVVLRARDKLRADDDLTPEERTALDRYVLWRIDGGDL